jgi:hypothetical protein
MMDKTCCGLGPAISQCLCERIHGQLAFHVPGQLPADALSAGEIQDHREVNIFENINLVRRISIHLAAKLIAHMRKV